MITKEKNEKYNYKYTVIIGQDILEPLADEFGGFDLVRGPFDVCREFTPKNGESVFDKFVNSPFRDSGLLGYLRKNGVNRLIITGLQTDYCIYATVKCGFEHGFEMIVPEYCNSTVDNEFMTADQTYHYYNDFMWKDRYAQCVSVRETIDMIRSK